MYDVSARTRNVEIIPQELEFSADS